MAHSRGIPEPSEYGKFARRILRGYGRRIENADPEDLADMLALSRDVDALIQATITNGRERWGWTWESIARAAGVTRSAAFQRWDQGKPEGIPVSEWPEREPAHGCQHAAEPAGSGKAGGGLFCGAPATEFTLPDSTTGYYCGTHGPKVIERNRRRLARVSHE